MTGVRTNRNSRIIVGLVASVTVAAVLAGCSNAPSIPGLANLLPEKEEPRLEGKRISLLKGDAVEETASVEVKEPATLPAQQENASWSQPGGVPSNAPGHLVKSGGLKPVWGESAGEGSSKTGRLTAVPIVHGGKVFTLDTEGQVSAFSSGSGKRLWRASLKPEHEGERAGFGGGLAAEGERVYAATGFGTVVALDAATGKVAWTKSLGVPIRSSPTAHNGRLYVVNTDSQLFALSAADGADLWTARGLPETASLLSNVSPAVSGDVLVVSYPSGEIAAFDVDTGAPRWTDSITRADIGSSLTAIGDPARPVIDGDMVFAVSRGGRMIATAKSSGERLWSREVSASQTPWVAGDTVYVVDVSGNLLALTRRAGKLRWTTALPEAKSWSGPVLAGGKLWLASSKGDLVAVDARSGGVSSKADIGDAVFITPVVASGRLYVMTDKARLIAIN